MVNSSTRKPLTVTPAGDAGAYLIAPLQQLEAVQHLLDENKISYSVDEITISLDGEPEVIFIDFNSGTDVQAVQRILDRVP